MKQFQNVLPYFLFSVLSLSVNAQYAVVTFTQSSYSLLANTSVDDYSSSNGINALSASLADRKINLEWSIPAHAKASTFIIERSLDGEHFEVIGSDATAVSNTGKKSFSFTDKPGNNAIQNRDIFYRLGVPGNNNEYQYTKPLLVRVSHKGIVDYITVFPHPTGNDINMIVGMKENGYLAARLSDEQGNEIMKHKGKINSGQQQLVLAGTNQLQPGNYWLEVMVDSKEALKMKLIKE